MTEQEWMVSDDPHPMLLAIGASVNGRQRMNVSDRKLRLFGCACCHQVWHLLRKEQSRRIVAEIEQRVDGAPDRFVSWDSIDDAAYQLGWHNAGEVAAGASRRCLALWDGDQADLRRRQTDILRCLFGNPWQRRHLCGEPHPGNNAAPDLHCLRCQSIVRWNGGIVVQMAGTLYDERRFEELPVLADALMDAGCPETVACQQCDGAGYLEVAKWVPEDDDMLYVPTRKEGCPRCGGTGRVPHPLLAHCRSGGPHARGCHVLDLLLGKE